MLMKEEDDRPSSSEILLLLEDELDKDFLKSSSRENEKDNYLKDNLINKYQALVLSYQLKGKIRINSKFFLVKNLFEVNSC